MNPIPASADCATPTASPQALAGAAGTTPVPPTTPISNTPTTYSWTNGDILAIAQINGAPRPEVAIGGNFTAVVTPDGTYHPATNFAVLDQTTGAVIFAGNANSYVRTIGSYAGTIYLGGNFTSINGVTRNHLAALSTSFAVTAWNPSPPDVVRAVTADPSGVYYDGDGGYARKVSATTGATIWTQFSTGGGFASLQLNASDTAIYIGGLFDSYAGLTRHGLVLASLTTGLPSPAFNANLRPNSHIGIHGAYDGEEVKSMALAPDNQHLVAGIAGYGSDETQILDLNTGALLWRDWLPGDDQAIGVVGDTYVVGYHRNNPNRTVPYPYFGAQLEASNGTLTTWDPLLTGNQSNADGGNNGIQAILSDPATGQLFIAGAFTMYNGVFSHKSLIEFSFQTGHAKTASRTDVSASTASASLGSSVTLSALVSSVTGAGVPTGTVQFQDNGTALGSPVALAAGSAQLTTTSLALGSHQITAVYSSDSIFSASTSAPTTVTVSATRTATSTKLAVSPISPAPQGSAVTLTATVSGASPTGTVTFSDGTTTLGTATLSGGVAKLVLSAGALAAGTHSLTAAYAGDAGNLPSTSSAVAYRVSSAPGTYVALRPTRLLDTRSDLGAHGPVAAGGVVRLKVTGGSVPDGVSAVVLNVTVTQPTAGGFLTAYADGQQQPLASNLNFVTGQTVPNLVVAPVDSNGYVDIYNGSRGTSQIVADLGGYFVGGTPTVSGAFAAQGPTRVLDTRVNLGGDGPVPANGVVRLKVTSDTVPAGVSAVVLNVTVTQPTAGGFLTAYADGAARPMASNLNFVAGQTVPNLVVAPVSTDGYVDIYNGSRGTSQIVADLAGYFLGGTPTVSGAFTAQGPTRVLDTRLNVGGPGPVAAGGVVRLKVISGSVPAGVTAVVLNVTVTQPAAGGFLTAYADGTQRPLASNLNFVRGQTVPNLVVAPVGTDGYVDIYNGSGGTSQIVADLAGYVS